MALNQVIPTCSGNVYTELVDWHISGFAVINCPVAWVRVRNLNAIAIKNITLQYVTYDIDGHLLNEGTYVIEDTVAPTEVKNFIELYLGLVDLHSERLNIKVVSVSKS